MQHQNNAPAVTGRILIAVLFLVSGLGKIAAPAMIQGYIAAVGLPAPLLGYLIAIVAVVLAVFTLAAALMFHHDLSDQNQLVHFFKNVAVIGGLLQVAAFGAGPFSLDARRLRAAQ